MPILQNGEIVLFGHCGDNWWDEFFTATQVINALAEVDPTDPITVRINSFGGYTDEGLAIFHALDRHQGKVTTVNEAMAASVASLIFMSGDERIALTASQTMIHDPMFVAQMANADDLRKAADQIDANSDEIAEIYAERASLSASNVRQMMKDETWMTAADAVEKGFATGTREAEGEPTMIAMFPYEIYKAPPPQIVATARQHGWTKETALRGGFFMADRNPTTAPSHTNEETAMSNENGTPTTQTELDDARREAAAEAQSRIQAIMTSEAAEGPAALAEHFAYQTQMSAEDAIAALEAAAQDTDGGNDEGQGRRDAGGSEDFDQRRMKASTQAQPSGGASADSDPNSKTINRADIFDRRRSAMTKGR
ncbi:MAG: head maturation protease, ClpP-related [Pseudomonadota bacterium]